MKNRSSTRDPYSTPARRRRIIAEIAKATLKKYCIQACDNVYRFRIETKASLLIQCIWRKYSAKQLLRILRFLRQTGAALRIQAIWRGKLARLFKQHLLHQIYQKKCRKLVKTMEELYFQRKQRHYQRQLRQQRRLRLKEQQSIASIMIQKHLRGRITRNRYHLLQQQFLLRQQAVRKIQSKWTAFQQRRRYLRYQSQKQQASEVIHRYGYCWYHWKVKWRKKRKCIVKIQSMIRMFLTKRKVLYWKRMKYLLEKEQLSISCSEMSLRVFLTANEVKRNPLFEQLFPNASFAHKTDSAEQQKERVEREQSPDDFTIQQLFKWCIDSGILSRDKDSTVSLGCVIQEAMQIFLSSESKLILSNDPLEQIITTLSTIRPEKSYIITKKPHIYDRYSHVLKLLDPELTLHPQTTQHRPHHNNQHHQQSHPLKHLQPSSSTATAKVSNDKLVTARQINSKTEFKALDDDVEEELSVVHEDMILERWCFPSNSTSTLPMLKLPFYWNEITILSDNDSSQRKRQLLLINRYSNKIEMKIINPTVLSLPSNSSNNLIPQLRNTIPSLEEIKKMKKGEKIEILKTKEHWQIITIFLELRDEEDSSLQPKYSELDDEQQIPPFDEMIVSLPSSFISKNNNNDIHTSKTHEIHFKVPLPDPIISETVLLSPPPEQFVEDLSLTIPPEKLEEELIPSPSSPPTPPPPSPPVIDYDQMARRIQRVVSERFEYKSIAQRMIVYYYRTYYLIWRKFRRLVYQAMREHRPRIILIQSLIRRYLAKKQYHSYYSELIQEYESFLEERSSPHNDFTHCNEYVNWKYFGMTPSLAERREKSVKIEQKSEEEEVMEEETYLSLIHMKVSSSFLSHPIEKKTAPTANDTTILPVPPLNQMNGKSFPPKDLPAEEENDLFFFLPSHQSSSSSSRTSFSASNAIRSLADNEFVSLVKMIQFPDIPPNCLLPFSSSGESSVLIAYRPKELLLYEEIETKRETEQLHSINLAKQKKDLTNESTTDEKEELEVAGKDDSKAKLNTLPLPVSSSSSGPLTNGSIPFSLLAELKEKNQEILNNLITKNRVFHHYYHHPPSLVSETTDHSLRYGMIETDDLSMDMKQGLLDVLKQYKQQHALLSHDNDLIQIDQEESNTNNDRIVRNELPSSETFYEKLLNNFLSEKV